MTLPLLVLAVLVQRTTQRPSCGRQFLRRGAIVDCSQFTRFLRTANKWGDCPTPSRTSEARIRAGPAAAAHLRGVHAGGAQKPAGTSDRALARSFAKLRAENCLLHAAVHAAPQLQTQTPLIGFALFPTRLGACLARNTLPS
jgi:hypothetical protein